MQCSFMLGGTEHTAITRLPGRATQWQADIAEGDLSGGASDARERFDSAWIEGSIFAHFELAAARDPHKVAVDDGVVRLTYRELRCAAQHLAHRIAMAVPVGRPVGILIGNGALFPVAALACLAVRRLYLPIHLDY